VIAIEVRGLKKTYGNLTAIDDFSFTAGRQELVALVGPDGAGKTSLFRALCGLIGFDAGEVRVAGYDVRTDFDSIKPLLGYMPQTFSLYPDLSVEENLQFYAGLFGLDRKSFNAKKGHLYEFSGLAPFAGRRAEHLSGGMKQKLALSCNLIHDPEVLVLDEPTTGVDPLSRKQFWEILKNLRDQGAAVVVSTPYMDEVELADRAVLMNKGRKLASGSPEDLVRAYRGQVFQIPRAPDTEAMRRLEGLEGMKPRRFGVVLRVYTPRGVAREEVARAVSDAGVDPAGIEEIPPDMEDVFVELMMGSAGGVRDREAGAM
jgi:ABC-2 type transport system ATP-binding protein